MIERVTYARLYALPGYENERFEAVAIVQNGDVDAAFDEVRAQVEAQYERVKMTRNAGAPTVAARHAQTAQLHRAAPR